MNHFNYKIKAYLESLSSLEELGELILGHIHLPSIHELQDGCQVLRKGRYKIGKGIICPSLSSKVPQSSGVLEIQKQRERAMQVIKLWPGKGHPSKWWWGAWPDSLPEEPVKIIRKLITIVFICRRYYMQKYKIMTNISFYSGIIPKTGATSKL